ncbi:hypothetical protein FPQ18DRAFT_305795 [Pyronema domesticum]|nr:hypothetical protein FPQ18DRAFT_305795 [Pyronema domesticum]
MANMKRKYESDVESDNKDSKRNPMTTVDSNSEDYSVETSSGHEKPSNHDDSCISSDLPDIDGSSDDAASDVGAIEQESSENEAEASDSEVDDSDNDDEGIEAEISDDEASEYEPDNSDNSDDEDNEDDSEGQSQPRSRGNRRGNRRRSRTHQNLENTDSSYNLDQSFTHTFNIRNVDTTYNFTLRSDVPNFETQEEFHLAVLRQLGQEENTANWVKYGALPYAGRFANWVPIDSNAWPLTPL